MYIDIIGRLMGLLAATPAKSRSFASLRMTNEKLQIDQGGWLDDHIECGGGR
jgi:hypothetical protein